MTEPLHVREAPRFSAARWRWQWGCLRERIALLLAPWLTPPPIEPGHRCPGCGARMLVVDGDDPNAESYRVRCPQARGVHTIYRGPLPE